MSVCGRESLERGSGLVSGTGHHVPDATGSSGLGCLFCDEVEDSPLSISDLSLIMEARGSGGSRVQGLAGGQPSQGLLPVFPPTATPSAPAPPSTAASPSPHRASPAPTLGESSEENYVPMVSPLGTPEPT